MARTYKRDKNGKFASTGGGGGSLRSTVQKKRSIGQARTYKPAANTPQGREVNRLTGSDKAVVATRPVAAGSMGKPGRRANVKLEKQRNASIVASSGASSRGKSLRQTVRAAESVRAAARGTTKNKANTPTLLSKQNQGLVATRNVKEGQSATGQRLKSERPARLQMLGRRDALKAGRSRSDVNPNYNKATKSLSATKLVTAASIRSRAAAQRKKKI